MKNTLRYTFACGEKGNTGRISCQFLIQRYIFVSSPELVAQ